MAGGFESLGLAPELIKAVCEDLGWLLPTDVQDEAIPLILGGGDVMAAAETGSGKTAAFALPMVQLVHETLRGEEGEERKEGAAPLVPAQIVMSTHDKDSLFKVEGGTECESSMQRWLGGRAVLGISDGLYYYEARVKYLGNGDGICRFGWSTLAGQYEIGKDANGWGYGGTAKKSHNGSFEDYGERYGDGDVIGCYLDAHSGSMSFSKNGTYLDLAYTINVATRRGTAYFPAVTLKNCRAVLNFGGQEFVYPPTHGYKGITDADPSHVSMGLSPNQPHQPRANTDARTPLALVLEPARDLAEQTYENIVAFARYLSNPEVRTQLITGGDDHRKTTRASKQDCDIVVATPGKIVDMVKRGLLDLSQVRLFILDEADRFLETENFQAIMFLYERLPKGGAGAHRLQVCFFSATLHSPQISDLAERICYNPTWVDLKEKDHVPETVHHVVFRLQPDWIPPAPSAESGGYPAPVTDGVHAPPRGQKEIASQKIKECKQVALMALLQALRMEQCLIFCRTNLDCDNLESFLVAAGGGRGRKFAGAIEKGVESPLSCCVLAGMRSMEERRRNLQAFKDGDVRLLICTDVAARGLDIKGLPYVINMTLPDEPEHYIHRVGRVGRAEAMGLAVSIVAAEGVQEKVWYHKCSSKGKGCTRRQLVEEGGCTIWYDEPASLSKVEARLGQPIAVMTADMRLPEGLGAVAYGEVASAATDATVSVHLQLLQPTVKELAEMEMDAQNNFLRLRLRYA